LFGDGSGSFSAPLDLTVGQDPRNLLLEDLDSDGNLDVVVANLGNNNLGVLLGRGSRTVPPHKILPVGKNPVARATGDLNLDGVPDLVVVNSANNNVSVFLSGP